MYVLHIYILYIKFFVSRKDIKCKAYAVDIHFPLKMTHSGGEMDH